jgi:DNA-binding NtrC family response regulator
VLLVDDSESVRLGLVAELEDEFDVVEASDARQAAKELRAQAFDVLVTDQNMPGGAGSDLLANVEKEFPAMVGILITGTPDSGRVRTLVAKAKESGRILVLYKPIEAKDLKVWVRNGVAMSRLAKLKGGGAPRAGTP